MDRTSVMLSMKRTWGIASVVFTVFLISLLTAPVSSAQTLDESISKIAGELAEQAQSKGATDLAIVGFSELNGYESAMTDYLAEELVTAFFAGGAFNIVERRELERVMAEQAKYSTDLFNPETIASFGELLGVDAIVTGSVTRLGRSVRLNARVIDVETARVFGASAATVTIDPFVEALLDQPRLSAESTTLVPGQVAQPSDVVFRNKVIQVTPTAVVLSRDRSSVTVTASIKNLTGKPIYVGYGLGNGDRTALTASGTVLNIGQPSGIGSEMNKTEIAANGTTLVSWIARANGGSSVQGQSLNLRDRWEIETGSGSSLTQVQFDRIRVE